MHQTRAETSRKIPIARKGTRYVARARGYLNSGVSIALVLRDMLGIARNMREIKLLIHERRIKINGKPVRDYHESLRLFNVVEAGDKKYKLTLLPTGRFSLHETKENGRIAKIADKIIVKGGKMQLNLHDGTNVLTDRKAAVGDSVELDFDNKIKRVIALEKGSKVFISSGRSIGKEGHVEHVSGKEIKIKIGAKAVELNKSHVIAL